MPRHTENLVGRRFGRLVVHQFAGYRQIGKKCKKQRAAFWTCDCDCGGVITTRASSLKSGYTKSCRCLEAETRYSFGEFIALPEGVGASRHVYRNYKYRAKKREIEFYLLYEEAMALFTAPCHYCGILPYQEVSKDYHGSFTYNGIDRVDNTGPYSVENCVPCCGRCNWAKGKDTVEQFREWVSRIYENMRVYSM